MFIEKITNNSFKYFFAFFALSLIIFFKNSLAQDSQVLARIPAPIPQNTPPSNAPIPVTTDSRIKTLVYNPNEVYQLKFHYGYQSYIEFGEDEEIEMISIGESFAWRLTPAGKRLFVRPLEVAAHTNMTIITNKRTYQFDIKSGEYTGRADEELVYIVRFYYPEIGGVLPIPSQLSAPICQVPVAPALPPQPPRSSIKSPTPPARVNEPISGDIVRNPDNDPLNFEYTMVGSAGSIEPIKVYDNGRETFFQFKENNLRVPSISTVDIFGGERPVSYIIRDDFVVVSGVTTQFTLRMADNLICVFNGKLVKPPANAR